uniref:Ribosomal protein S10 n=1 Tax=Berkeleya fennica TaxID=1577906 RepID=A0A0U1XY59_BERFE|nr:ribosomal protein S10 [Berkeleya fennica]AJA05804.1 ribosomal protein S10 [Berkeleya fennica]
MKSYHLIVQSRNRKSISTFFPFFLSSIQNLNFNIIQKYFEKKRKKKILTILKSPHVNKKAQEQFEFRYYSKQITLHSTQNFKHLIF